MVIRIDCYLSKMKDFQKTYPNAKFVRVDFKAKSLLSPSAKLLVWAGIFKDFKTGQYRKEKPFEEYAEKYEQQILRNPKAVYLLKRLFLESKEGKVIFLVCVERDPKKCHRSILKDMIDNITYRIDRG